MLFRFGLLVSALMIAGVPAAAAQATASVVVRATVRPGNCPVHSNCGKKPGKGPRATDAGLTAGVRSLEISILAFDSGTHAAMEPLHVVIRPPDALRAAGVDLAVSWHPREIESEGLWLHGLLSSAQPAADAYSGLVTVVVEY